MTKGIFFNNFETSYIPEILTEIYRDHIYKPYFDGRNDLTVVDIGANIGLFTFYASQFASTIYSVEPAKEHFEVLNQMVEFNKFGEKVTAINKAIGNHGGKSTLYHNENVTMFSLKEQVNTMPAQAEEVEVITVKDLFDSYNLKNVDFLKLDIEGLETEVICGKGFEPVAKRIKAMVVEWHTWSGSNPSQLVTALSDYGFEVTPIPSNSVLFGATRK